MGFGLSEVIIAELLPDRRSVFKRGRTDTLKASG